MCSMKNNIEFLFSLSFLLFGPFLGVVAVIGKVNLFFFGLFMSFILECFY